MPISDQPKLRFRGVDIFDVKFTAYKPATHIDEGVELGVSPGVLFKEDDPKAFKILMEVKLNLPEFFELQLKAIGSFETTVEITDETREQLINQNASAIMFPYVRSFITGFTASLGNVTGPIVIPIQFFAGKLEELKLNTSNVPELVETQSIPTPKNQS